MFLIKSGRRVLGMRHVDGEKRGGEQQQESGRISHVGVDASQIRPVCREIFPNHSDNKARLCDENVREDRDRGIPPLRENGDPWW